MTFNFRPLQQSDFPQFATWLAQPHVQKWWPEEPTTAYVSEKYGARTRGDDPTAVYVVEADMKPIGIIQSFVLADYPEYGNLFGHPSDFSIDYLIGEPDYVGRGVGTAMIKQFIQTIGRANYPTATGVSTAPDIGNAASIRVLEKVGFKPGKIITGEHGPEQVMRLML